jgi:hypothetical protein
MSAGVMVPVIVPAEAADLIHELGLGRPVEEMIEHTRQVVAGLYSIEIEAWYEQAAEDRPPLPHVTVIAWRDGCRTPADEAMEREWFAWCAQAYAPEVKQHVSFVVQGRGEHGR